MQAVCGTGAECDCRSLGSQGTELSVLSRPECRKTQGVDRDAAALLDISRSFLVSYCTLVCSHTYLLMRNPGLTKRAPG